MEFLADTFILWLVLSAALIGATYFYRRTRKVEQGFFVTADDFSVRKIMLDVRKGEGDIFLGFLLSMVFFSMFLAGIVRFFRGVFT
ncbi:MAG TPA: hypothetical protein VF678_10895 [bacterium]